MEKNLSVLSRIQNSPEAAGKQDAHIDASYSGTDFESTAWRTAQATGALSYMPYEEAQKFSGIYDAVQSLEKAQQTIEEDEAQFLGVVRRYASRKGDISKEEADAMAERFGIWQGHLLSVHIAARLLQEEESAFLEHREPKRTMSENIHD